MRANRAFVVLMSSAALTVMAVGASAQGLQNPLPVGVGQTVRITSADGKVTKGKIRMLTPASVIFESPGGSANGQEPVNLAVADVRRIQVSDSVTNGVVIGALSLGGVGALWGAAGDGLTDFTSLIFTGKEDDSNYALTFTVAGAAVGALLGYAIDAGKMKTIYKREDGGMTVSVRPIASAAGKGVGVRLRW